MLDPTAHGQLEKWRVSRDELCVLNESALVTCKRTSLFL